MSLVLQSSGGGQITIQEPATASNFTANLPAATGTVMVSGNIPAFSAIRATGDINLTASTWTKVSFNSTDFDTATIVNTSTGTVTPNVAGYYQINCSWYLNYGSSFPVRGGLRLYKNGSVFKGDTTTTATLFYGVMQNSFIVFCNGTTDYLEMYALQASSTDAIVLAGGTYTYMSGVLVRAS
jgi:hypothetical protein